MVNKKRVHRIYKEEGLFLRTKAIRRRKHGAILRVPPPTPAQINEVWSMDLVHDELADGKKSRALAIVDKLSREAPAITVDFRLTSNQVIETLEMLKIDRGLPKIISVDNGSEFTSRALEQWAYLNEINIHFIRPGKSTENGHIESFNGRFRDECMNTQCFLSMRDAQSLIEPLAGGLQSLPPSQLDWKLNSERVCEKKNAFEGGLNEALPLSFCLAVFLGRGQF